MTLTKITGSGIVALGMCVTVLWGCLIGERLMVQRGATEQARALHDLEVLRQQLRTPPVSAPILRRSHRRHSTEG